MKTREEALALLHEYIQSPSLITHALTVESCMSWYADYFLQQGHPLNSDEWKITGLLHDFDYEKYPSSEKPEGHPYKGNAILAELGYPEAIRTAIMGHAEYTQTPRITLLDKTLFAVDELSGLITACVYVRPDRSLKALEVKSVLKKLKDKAFARGCNRDDIKKGAEELGVPLEQHVANCINAMQPLADRLAGNSH